MRTVSGNVKYMEECRRGARFLKNILQQLGAVSRMVTAIAGAGGCVVGYLFMVLIRFLVPQEGILWSMGVLRVNNLAVKMV